MNVNISIYFVTRKHYIGENSIPMSTNKLTDLLSTFTREEFRQFGLFISSPFFNKEFIQIKLYEILKKHHPDFDSRGFNKPAVFARLYPHKKYSDGTMRNIFTRTLSLAQDFLSVWKYRNDTYSFNMNLLSELSARRQTVLFEKKKIDVALDIETEKHKTESFYYRRFLFIDLQRRFKNTQKSLFELMNETLYELSDNFSVFFMIGMLRMYTLLSNTNRYMLHYELNKNLMDGIEFHIRENYENYKNITYLVLYYNFYMLAKTGNEKHYYDLFELMMNKSYELEHAAKQDLYTILANYCYTKINKGEMDFINQQFYINKQKIETEFYKSDAGFMSHILYINVVITGLEAGEELWVREFMEKYKQELDQVNRENTYIFCCSFYHYWIKDYSKSLELAAKVKTDDLSYKHQLRSLYLKIYFDLNEAETFYSHIDSYKHFIASSSNVSGHLRETINNYINFAKKLFDLKYDRDINDTELAMVKKDIINNKAMINKPWLLRKIEEIEKTI